MFNKLVKEMKKEKKRQNNNVTLITQKWKL